MGNAGSRQEDNEPDDDAFKRSNGVTRTVLSCSRLPAFPRHAKLPRPLTRPEAQEERRWQCKDRCRVQDR